jgi:outer membrane cobalamin receptor
MRFDLALEWSATAWMEVYAAVDNVFDADYEEAVGFPSVPIRPRAGVRLRY